MSIASLGSTATNSVMTPIPPNHCVIARQNNIARPSRSKSVKMVAPVVVNPDIDSKKASMGRRPAHTYGIAPRLATNNHVPETTASASIRRRFSADSFPATTKP